MHRGRGALSVRTDNDRKPDYQGQDSSRSIGVECDEFSPIRVLSKFVVEARSAVEPRPCDNPVSSRVTRSGGLPASITPHWTRRGPCLANGIEAKIEPSGDQAVYGRAPSESALLWWRRWEARQVARGVMEFGQTCNSFALRRLRPGGLYEPPLWAAFERTHVAVAGPIWSPRHKHAGNADEPHPAPNPEPA